MFEHGIWVCYREERGGVGGVSPRKSVVQPPASMASKVFIEETDKNFDFITDILLPFLGFGDVKVSIVIEN